MTIDKARKVFPKGTEVRWTTMGSLEWSGRTTGRMIPNPNGDCYVQVMPKGSNQPLECRAESLLRVQWLSGADVAHCNALGKPADVPAGYDRSDWKA